MQWSDITAPPPEKLLKQFAGLCLVVFGGLALWRIARVGPDTWAAVLAVLAVGIGVPGLIQPRLVRWVFTAWMVAAFPIGWTVSRVILALMFFLVFTPIALVFRLVGRDALQLGRRSRPSYWTAKQIGARGEDYFRQF